jgi:7-carboxy-7-deazaguanine synthase
MRVSEVYASSQGEGPNVGRTTVFLRFGGCNLRCPGWPCDTQHAIQPTFRKEWIKHDVDELLERVVTEAQSVGAEWITLTGGEPFLQPKEDLKQLTQALWEEGYEIEAFSNGTILYPDWAVEQVHFIMDWKLPGSGEDPHNQNRLVNLYRMNTVMRDSKHNAYMIDRFDDAPKHATKFVIKDQADLVAAHSLWSLHLKNVASEVEVFYGKVWEGELSDADLVKYVMDNQLPWRLNRQEHNYIWPPNERGR